MERTAAREAEEALEKKALGATVGDLTSAGGTGATGGARASSKASMHRRVHRLGSNSTTMARAETQQGEDEQKQAGDAALNRPLASVAEARTGTGVRVLARAARVT